MADKQLIINSNSSETRIAYLEKGRVAEVFIERHRDRGIVGNIYKGVVTRVLPGMQSAFVNIGIGRSAFLYGGDVMDPNSKNRDNEFLEDAALLDMGTKESHAPIETLLKEGQEVIVQVAKEPLGTKGARVTTYLSIPGRYLVLMPDLSHVGISRRIDDEAERERLKAIVTQIKPPESGVIIRTAARGIDESLLLKDLKYLLKLNKKIQHLRKRSGAPALIYRDLDIILKTTRDLYHEDIEQIVIDHEDAYEHLKNFLKDSIPSAAKKLSFYKERTPIFDFYEAEMDISKALGRRVDLPSGGYLIIDQTEALTTFDVNTGRFVGQASAQETILRTNLEAVKAVVQQLRIRNIGGIIILDFIDMEDQADRDRIYETLKEELKQDKARSNVLKVSELGLVEMTRKRTADSLERQLMESCPFCNGIGRVRSTETEAYDLLREIKRHALQTAEKKLRIKVRSDLRDWILEEETELYHQTIHELGVEVEFIPSNLNLNDLKEATYEVLSSN